MFPVCLCGTAQKIVTPIFGLAGITTKVLKKCEFIVVHQSAESIARFQYINK
jgi:hypothetical protein